LTGDLSFHRQIKQALTAAGFIVGRIQKHWFHDVYEISLQRGVALRETTENQLRRKIAMRSGWKASITSGKRLF